MKKSQMYKKVNRKNRMFNHVNRNVVYPTIYFNPNIHEGTTNTVEIIELNSDGIEENEQHNSCDNRHSWCNTSDESQEGVDEYLVNRPDNNDNRFQNNENSDSIKNSYKYYDEDVLNQIFTDFYGIDCRDRGERIPTKKNPNSEFFTIINNHVTSETSSEKNAYDDIEIMQCDSTINNNYYSRNNESFEGQNNLYASDFESEKRTIWIYALKNQRYLEEQDFQLNSSPSNSTADEEASPKEIPMIRRLATPIPTYIPRLNLPISPTLPTVKEITEPNKLSLNSSEISPSKTVEDNVPFKTSMNSWLKNEITKTHKDKQGLSIEEAIVKPLQNLSPRERRRLRINKMDEYDNPNQNKGDSHEYCEPTVAVTTTECRHTLNIESSANDTKKNNGDCLRLTKINNTKDEGSFIHINNRTMNETLCNLQKPHLKLIKTLANKNNTTDPLEKLDGNWIGENKEVLEVYDCNIQKAEENDGQENLYKTVDASDKCASDRLFIRNVSLLKPAEWKEYLPVTGSVSSLYLSISLDTDCDNKKKSWFKRFLNFIHCCK